LRLSSIRTIYAGDEHGMREFVSCVYKTSDLDILEAVPSDFLGQLNPLVASRIVSGTQVNA